MRILMVHPGPDFSVADVFNGWHKALEKQGHQVMVYNTNDRITFFDRARMPAITEPVCPGCEQHPYEKPLNYDQVTGLSMAGIFESAYTFWPDMIFFVSGFYTNDHLFQVLKSRGHKLVMLHTESPYEDERQKLRGRWMDMNLLNDPTNLQSWRDDGIRAEYYPHSYDPDTHYPSAVREYDQDFTFIGSPFKSRCEFFSRMDFEGIDFTLGGGGWGHIAEEHKGLLKYMGHDLEMSVDNWEAAKVYRKTKVGINIYRREGESKDKSYEGYAMGPREVEMAATGLFYLRDHRPESDQVFQGILPAFDSPEHASELLHYWAKNDREREAHAGLAREQVKNWTFDNRAKNLMELLSSTGVIR